MLVPIKDSDGKIIAVFGIDYSAPEWYSRLWKRMIPDIIIVLFFLMFVIALKRAAKQYFKLKDLSRKLAFNETLYHSVFDQAPIGIAVVNDKNFVSAQSVYGNTNMNPMFEQILGRTSKELTDKKWTEITHPDDLQEDLEKFGQFRNGNINGYSMKKRFLRPDGSYVWTYMKVSNFLGGKDKDSAHICILDDITSEVEITNSLLESERSKSVLLSNLPGMAYRCSDDGDWTMKYVSAGCFALTGYNPESLVNNKDISFNDLVAPEYRDMLHNEWKRILADRRPFRFEYENNDSGRRA